MKKQLVYFASFGLVWALGACKTAKPVTQSTSQQNTPVVETIVKTDYQTRMQVKQLKAVDLEEDLSFADEIVLNYTLTAVDDQGKIAQVATGSFGVESVKAGQILTSERFKPIELVVPENGRLLVSVVLNEIDDYTKAQELVKKINEFGGIAKIPAVMVSIAEYQTPLAIVFGSLQAAGLGLKAAERFDKDDLLGQNTFQLSAQELKSGKTLYTVPLVFKGEHLKNSFQYELTYDLQLKLIKTSIQKSSSN
ncbi:hypothetical protein ACWA1C_05660 [Flectobacillus roseus]